VWRSQTGVADVRLNRPEKMNALDPAMFEALVDAGKRVTADGAVRAVVLSGEGRAFCAGLDFASFTGMLNPDRGARNLLERTTARRPTTPQRAAYVWQEVPVPVIAAVRRRRLRRRPADRPRRGHSVFVAPDAQLSVMEIKWGLIPDMSGTQTLRHLVRLGRRRRS